MQSTHLSPLKLPLQLSWMDTPTESGQPADTPTDTPTESGQPADIPKDDPMDGEGVVHSTLPKHS